MRQSSEINLAQGFLNSAAKFPQRPAIHIAGTLYSYSDLLQKTELVFNQLSKDHVPQFIGIYCAENIFTYSAILSISAAGACYVPLNPKLPDIKLQEIISGCNLRLIITEHVLPFKHAARELLIDTNSTAQKPVTKLITQPYAYLLFTSGSTGQPKGVPVSHKNVNSFFDHYRKGFDFNEKDRFLQPYELSFDVSVFSMFAAWNCGACVFVVPDKGFKYLNIINVIRQHQITVTSMVPTVLPYIEKYLPEFCFPELRYSFFSGDKLFHHLAAKWQKAAPKAKIFNCYGPTETTIVCTSYLWTEKKSAAESFNEIVPIGKPFPRMDYILTGSDNEVLKGKPGELCFTGDQVIASYLNDAHPDNFFLHKGKRYYKTGDIAGTDKNKNLLFHGRKDAQFKINGYRVEAAEVENAVRKLTAKNCCVTSVSNKGLPELIAFIESEDDKENLFLELCKVLPDYMVPSELISVPVFPKNMNGKIDVQKLRESYERRPGK